MAEKTTKAVVDLVINGQSATLSVKDLGTAMKAVNKELREMSEAENPTRYQQLRKEKATITAEYRKQKQAIGDVRTEWQKFASEAKSIAAGVFGGNLLTAGLQKAINVIPQLIGQATRLSDQFSDVAKTTGLTREEVSKLNKELMKIDTRTSMEQLRNFAEMAGRLGYSTEKEILGFVKAADQINVALGDVLGADAIKDVAKITDIFKLKDIYGVEEAMLRVGSAINEAGMASTANEGYMVDFVNRMAGIANTAKIDVTELIAMAGTLDSLGQSSEVGSTALSKMITKMGSEVPKYAKLAGMEVDKFRDVLKRSAMEGLMLVIQNVGKTTNGIEDLAMALGDMEMDGGRMVGILGSLAKNSEEYYRQLGITMKGMQEGTSITNEFAEKNNNAAASLEKMKKWVENQTVALQENTAHIIVNMIPAFQKLGAFIIEHTGLWKALGLMMLVYYGNVIKAAAGAVLNTTAIHANRAALVLQLVALKAYEYGLRATLVTLQLFRGKITLTTVLTNTAAAASRALAAVWAANPVGVVITALAGAAAALKLYSDNTKEAIALEKQRITLAAQISEGMKQQEKLRDILNNRVQDYNRMSSVEQANLKKEIVLRYGQLQAQIKNIEARKLELEQMAAVPTIWQKAMAMLKSGGNMSAYTANLASYAAENISGVNVEFKSKLDELKSTMQSYEQMMGQISRLDVQTSEIVAGKTESVSTSITTEEGKKAKSPKASAEKKSKEKAPIESRYDIKPKNMTKQMNADLKDGLDIAMIPVEDAYAQQKRDIELAHAKGTLNDTAYYEQKLQAEEQYLTSKILLEETYGQSSVETQNKLADASAKIATDRARIEKEQLEEIEKAEKKLQDVKRDALEQGISTLKGFFDETSIMFKALLVGEKAMAVANIILNLQKEMANINATSSAAGPWYAAVAAPLMAAAKIRAGISIATVAATTIKGVAKKAVGGYTDVETLTRETGGYVGKATLFSSPGRQYIAGEAGTEFILNNRSLQYPAVAQFASMMDAIQTSKNYSALANIGTSGGSQIEMAAVIAELRALGNKVDSLANRPIEFPVTRFHEKEDFLMRIQNEVNA